MVERLAAIAKEAEQNNEYFERKSIDELEPLIRKTEQDGDDEERFLALWRIGPHLLRMGRSDEAVAQLEEAVALLPKVQDRLTDEQLDVFLLDVAVAHLRTGESQNCIHCQAGESCIFPIQGRGVHQQREGSENAAKYLKQLLERDPNNLDARWLLNVANMTLGEHETATPKEQLIPVDAFLSGPPFPEFKDIARDVGAAVFSLSGGVAADDFDGDGDVDIITSNWDVRGKMTVLLNKGDGEFTDATPRSGLDGIFGGLNLIHADYDNDGDLDVFVLRGAWLEDKLQYPNSLLQNDGTAKFRDVSFESGLGDVHRATQTAAWADYDNDGDLDLYIGNEQSACQLFNNDGKGHFKDVAKQARVTDGGFAKGVVWGDYNNDRFPDIFVSNGNGPNRLFHNNRDGTFRNVAEELNVLRPLKSFPTWFWDYDNDGVLDLYVSAYEVGVRHVAAGYLGIDSESPFPCVYRGDGAGGFTDVAAELDLHKVAQPMGANFGDLDNDGYPDFYLGTGYPDYKALMPNLLYHNKQGRWFEDVTMSARVGHLQKGHGVAFADFNRDGDQDIFIETGGGYAGDGFRNVLFDNPGFGKHFIEVKLTGVTSNRSAIGARIKVDIEEGEESRSVYRHVNTGGSFGSNPLAQHIGVGTAKRITTLEVYWPTTGKTQVFENLDVNQRIQITEGDDEIR